MKHFTTPAMFILLLCTLFSCKQEQQQPEENTVATDTIKTNEEHRIISLNGTITEIISALGHKDEIVGVDVTSGYPEDIKESATDMGHTRSISIESVMELKPTLILATSNDISPELREKMELSGVTTRIFDQEYSPEGTKKLIGQIATVLQSDKAQELSNKIDEDLANVEQLKLQPSVLFIYARGAGTLMVSGTNTPVDKVIALAGGKNVITDFEDYKPLTAEALIQSNPDAILMFNSGIESLGGPEGVMKIQGIEKTKAGKNKNIIAMDGTLLSGFGPRLGEAAVALNKKLGGNSAK